VQGNMMPLGTPVEDSEPTGPTGPTPEGVM
jgi:hypothetical protein